MHDPMTRWQEIRKTSPSGKTMFVCMSCGLATPAPSAECRTRVKVHYQGADYFMPCSAWPMPPEEYVLAMLTDGENSYFTGTVVMPGGGRIGISAPIPEAVAREIACISIQYDLLGEKKSNRLKAQRELQRDMEAEAQTRRTQHIVPPTPMNVPQGPPLLQPSLRNRLINHDDK